MLTGGSNSPTIAVTVTRPFSTNIVFDPVDYRLLNVESSGINVQVSTNGVPSVCTGSCGYAFIDYAQITSMSQSGNVLSLALSDPMGLNFGISAITVTVQGRPCSVNAGSTAGQLTCNMAANTDSSPIIVAGIVTPVVSIAPYGIAKLANAVSPFSVNFVVSSLSASSGSSNGGYLISLNGAGFPLDLAQISITLCGNLATITTVSNIKADFYVPACSSLGAQTVTVAFGALSDTNLSFNYITTAGSTPSIVSISPSSHNPAIKGKLTINGNNFGTNISATKVFLSNATGKVY